MLNVKKLFDMLGLTFNQTVAILGIIYAAVLFYYYRRLKAVWRREAERSRYDLILFTILTLFTVGASCYMWYLIKKRQYLQRKAADLIQMEKGRHRPSSFFKNSWFGKFVKIFVILLLVVIVIHRIIKKT